MSAVLLHLTFALGGGLGAVSRHFLTRLITHRLPLSTLLVNVAGSFLLGAGVGLLDGTGGSAGDGTRQLVFGFCGGFTTFSSFAWQTLELHRGETLAHVAVNIAASLALCVVAFGLALTLAS